MKKINILFLTFSLVLLLTGCGSNPHRIDPEGSSDLITTHEINFKDWQNVADKAAESLVNSGVLKRNDGQKNILMISEIKNKTTQHINTEILTDRIRGDLLKSKLAMTTTAISLQGPEDKATREVRILEHDELFDKSTVQKNATAIAPNMSLSGTIIQKKTKYSRSEESYFFFHVVLTDLKTGLAVWEDNFEIAKQKQKSFMGY